MKAINEELERIIKLNGITKRENILYGSNEAKVTGVSPTARGVKANFDGLQYFFFYFDEKGITLFPLYKDEYGLLPWENITEFKFQRAADFLIGRVGKENIVSAVVHMDEKRSEERRVGKEC